MWERNFVMERPPGLRGPEEMELCEEEGNIPVRGAPIARLTFGKVNLDGPFFLT